jgi:flavin-dependent dehydrogenase
VRRAVFTHIEDGLLDDPEFDREKILITVHEKDHRAWYWLIPFADGRSSFGIVASKISLKNTVMTAVRTMT